MIRVCPERDAACPHGLECRFWLDQYRCDIKASRMVMALRAEAKHDQIHYSGGEDLFGDAANHIEMGMRTTPPTADGGP